MLSLARASMHVHSQEGSTHHQSADGEVAQSLDGTSAHEERP
jgi:hypothetical protein